MKKFTFLTGLLMAAMLMVSLNLFATDYVVSGAGIADINGTYVENGTNCGKPKYEFTNGATTYYLAFNNIGFGDYWIIGESEALVDMPGSEYYISSSSDTPPSSGWNVMNSGDPAPTVNALPEQIPFSDGFETGSLQSYWTTGGNGTPTVSTSQVYSGIYALDFNTATENNSYIEVELEAATDPVLTFQYYFDYYYNKDLTVDIYTNGSWTTNIWTDDVTYSTDDMWLHAEVDLAAYDTESGSFKLKFILTDNLSYGSYNYYMDEISVGGPSNPSPNNSNNNDISGTLTWDHAVNVSTYDVKLGEAGNMITVESGSAVSGSSGSYSYSGLGYQKEYEWQIIYYKADATQIDGPVWSFQTKFSANGDGSASNPYEISSTDDLIALSQNSDYWQYHFIQTADLAFDATEGNVDWNGDGSTGPADGFSPIGLVYGNHFSGSYNGQNHTIDNLFINRSGTTNIGLFGYTYNATIENLGVTNVDIMGNSYTGALIGNSGGGSVANCYSTGDVSSSARYIGGLIGSAGGSVSDSYSSCKVISTRYGIGGLIGDNSASIDNCYSTGDVDGDSYVGGLVGYNMDPISQSYSTGNVSARYEAGGLIGVNIYDAIENCYSTGDVTFTTASGTVGAFIGSNGEDYGDPDVNEPGGNISYCYATGNVVYDGGTNPIDKGFVGVSVATGDQTPVYTANFFDSEASNQSTATGATGKTTAEMQTQSTFTGWDFETVWSLSPSYNNGYPNLDGEGTDYIWDGSVSSAWNTAGNWDQDLVPTGFDNVTVANTSNDPVIGSGVGASCKDLTVNSGATLTVQDGGSLITNGTITNNGIIDIEHTMTDGHWHLVSSPVEGAEASVFTGDYLQYFTEETGLYTDISDANLDLIPCQGYSWRNFAKGDFTFSGTPYTGDQSIATTANNANGWNLVGNPYPSSLDWNTLDDTYGTIYTFSDNGVNSGWGTYNNGASVNNGNRYVAPMQGFFIATSGAGTFTVTNAARSHENATGFVKDTEALMNSAKIFAQAGDKYDETFIQLGTQYAEGFDFIYDGWKMAAQDGSSLQLSTLSIDGKLCIDRRPEVQHIPLSFSLSNQAQASIGAKEISDLQELTLEDTKLNLFTNLANGAYQFDWNTGDSEERFILHLKATGTSELEAQAVQVYGANSQIYVSQSVVNYNEMKVYDLSGRLVYQNQLNDSNLQSFSPRLNFGVYLVELNGENGVKSFKIVL